MDFTRKIVLLKTRHGSTRISTYSPILSPGSWETPRAKHSSVRHPLLPVRELSASPFLRLSTRLLSCTFLRRPLLGLAAALRSNLLRPQVNTRSRLYERMITLLMDKLATHKCYGNVISIRERLMIINTLHTRHSHQVIWSLSWW